MAQIVIKILYLFMAWISNLLESLFFKGGKMPSKQDSSEMAEMPSKQDSSEMAEMPSKQDSSEMAEMPSKQDSSEVAEMPSKQDSSEMAEMPERYLRHTKEIMEKAQMTTSGDSTRLKFNHSQCKYLADKLKDAVDSAHEFLELLNEGRYKTSPTPEDMAESLEIFKLLYAMAKEAEIFIQECCKDAWIPAAMKLTNTLEHISSIGFHLELCRVVFLYCRKLGASDGYLSLKEVDKMNKREVETVQERASNDKRALLIKVEATLLDRSSKSSTENRQLATRLLGRLGWIPARDLPESFREEFCVTESSTVIEIKKLGEGSYGRVHRGKWLGLDVAKKVTIDGFSFASFEKEVSIQAGLSHSNIPSLYCYADEDLMKTIIMELMDINLNEHMQDRVQNSRKNRGFPFTILVAIDIILQVGEAMHYLHGMEIVHRDLKSLNILVSRVHKTTEYVIAKVSDFGESKAKDMTVMTSNRGTLRWKAPEMIRSEEEEYKGVMQRHPYKCDIYSFAMVCYEILTGKFPFSNLDKNEASEIKRMILRGDRPKLPDRCPEALTNLIVRCWSRDASKRPIFDDICKELRHLKYELLMSFAWRNVSTLASNSVQPLIKNDNVEKVANIIEPTYATAFMGLGLDDENQELGDGAEPGLYSITCYPLERSIRQVSETSRHWTLLTDLTEQSEDKSALEMSNREYFKRLKHEQDLRKAEKIRFGFGRDVPGFFRDMDDLTIGEKIGEGAQAEIYEASGQYMVKVFRGEYHLEALKRWFPLGMLNAFERDSHQGSPLSLIHGATMVDDARFGSRFAIVMHRKWGDLRKLIELRMQRNHNQTPPFTEDEVIRLMFGIAKDMMSLHSQSPPILHRDLKAANVLVQGFQLPSLFGCFEVTVSDFELSQGVIGTGFWRAPELLQQLKERVRYRDLVFTEKCDVYSYGMTCFELVTGSIPFEGCRPNDYELVLQGERPRLPLGVHPVIKSVINSCWDADPRKRPSFQDIVEKHLQNS